MLKLKNRTKKKPRVAVPFDQLTPREHDVMRLLVKGLSNKLIAAELHVSDHTAKFHVTNLLDKLASSTRVEIAVNYALWEANQKHKAELAAARNEMQTCGTLAAVA